MKNIKIIVLFFTVISCCGAQLIASYGGTYDDSSYGNYDNSYSYGDDTSTSNNYYPYTTTTTPTQTTSSVYSYPSAAATKTSSGPHQLLSTSVPQSVTTQDQITALQQKNDQTHNDIINRQAKLKELSTATNYNPTALAQQKLILQNAITADNAEIALNIKKIAELQKTIPTSPEAIEPTTPSVTPAPDNSSINQVATIPTTPSQPITPQANNTTPEPAPQANSIATPTQLSTPTTNLTPDSSQPTTQTSDTITNTSKPIAKNPAKTLEKSTKKKK